MWKKHLSASHQLWSLLLSAIRPLPAFLALALGFSGCAAVDQDETQNLSAAEQIRFQTLMERGQEALRAGGLVEPNQSRVASAGAAEYFYQALAIQPNNPTALRGLEQILEQYLTSAIDAADAGDFASAYRLLTAAKSIDARHPSVEPAQAYVTSLAEADFKSVVVAGLPPSALSRVIDNLLLEVKANATSCRFRLFAPSDPQTRALYQALREGYVRNNLGTRIRASSTISQPLRLERICTP